MTTTEISANPILFCMLWALLDIKQTVLYVFSIFLNEVHNKWEEKRNAKNISNAFYRKPHSQSVTKSEISK